MGDKLFYGLMGGCLLVLVTSALILWPESAKAETGKGVSYVYAQGSKL
ncbi:MAG: hypothetical protein QM645_13835 [Asticcacaulis sp.]